MDESCELFLFFSGCCCFVCSGSVSLCMVCRSDVGVDVGDGGFWWLFVAVVVVMCVCRAFGFGGWWWCSRY